MNTPQIVIFIILGIMIGICYFKIAFSIDERKIKGLVYLFVYTLIIGILFMKALLSTLEVNDLEKQVKNKCPEYEKIENVYKLKQ